MSNSGDVVSLTLEGKARLEAQLHELKTVRRPEIASLIHESQGGGPEAVDAQYEDAKNQQAFNETKINELERLLENVDIIDEDVQSATVQLGSHVILRDPDGKQYRYVLVGAAEALPSQGKLSEQSPLGQALIGKKKGQQFSFAAPKGEVTFKVTKVG
jgi:transcription elongation factor GreA